MLKLTFFTITAVTACALSLTLAIDADFFGAGIAFLLSGAFMYAAAETLINV